MRKPCVEKLNYTAELTCLAHNEPPVVESKLQQGASLIQHPFFGI